VSACRCPPASLNRCRESPPHKLSVRFGRIPRTHCCSMPLAIDPVVPPLPSCNVPPLITVPRVYVFAPVSVSVPPEIVRPPLPLMTPLNSPEASLSSSLCDPKLTAPEPDRL